MLHRSLPESKREDYLLDIVMISGELRIEPVRCKVYLPYKLADAAFFYFHLTKDQARMIDANSKNLWKFSVVGDLKGTSGDAIRIEADEVYMIRMNTQYWGQHIQESIMIAQPMSLRIKQFLPFDSEATTKGAFWLSPLSLLNPFWITKRHYNGNVEVETSHFISFTLANGVQLDFKTHFITRTNEDGDDVTHSSLVAEFELENTTDKPNDIDDAFTGLLDDFLLLASFAARQRCVWIRWETAQSNCVTKLFRSNVTIPEAATKDSRNKGLIEEEDFEEFLRKTYQHFLVINPNDLLCLALNYSIPNEKSTVEGSFTTLYSALETLVLNFRRNNDLEFVFSADESKWSQIQKDLKRCLKQHPALDGEKGKVKRKLVYENLSALNRVSFSTAFQMCCDFYSINLDDLWPVIESSEGWSLSTIRNKLVHGESLSDPKLDALLSALKQLQWTVERLILAVLGWDISRSKVSPTNLSNHDAAGDWRIDRHILSN